MDTSPDGITLSGAPPRCCRGCREPCGRNEGLDIARALAALSKAPLLVLATAFNARR